jgi:hypothetical protein
VNTQITISADAVMVNTESGTTGSTVTEREIQDVPLLNRSVLDLALTLPNVSGDAGSEHPVIVTVTTCPGCNLSVNGGRPLNTLMLADGANNTGISLARSIVSFTPETVQEFTVQTSVYSAEYSSTGGGGINATTKSGSNRSPARPLVQLESGSCRRAIHLASQPLAADPERHNSRRRRRSGFTSFKIKGKPRRPQQIFWFGAIEPEYRRDYLTNTHRVRPRPTGGDFSAW